MKKIYEMPAIEVMAMNGESILDASTMEIDANETVDNTDALLSRDVKHFSVWDDEEQ
jgi:hypothetical protein